MKKDQLTIVDVPEGYSFGITSSIGPSDRGKCWEEYRTSPSLELRGQLYRLLPQDHPIHRHVAHQIGGDPRGRIHPCAGRSSHLFVYRILSSGEVRR